MLIIYCYARGTKLCRFRVRVGRDECDKGNHFFVLLLLSERGREGQRHLGTAVNETESNRCRRRPYVVVVVAGGMERVVATAITSAIVPFFSVWAAIMMGVDLTRLRAMREAVRGRLCPLTMSVCHPGGGGGSDYVRPRLEKVGLELMESICAQSSPPFCAQFN